jgi:hypothetical protein
LRLGLASNPRSWPGQFELGKLELSAAENAKVLAPGQAVVYWLLAAIHLRQQNYPPLTIPVFHWIWIAPQLPARNNSAPKRNANWPTLPERPRLFSKTRRPSHFMLYGSLLSFVAS